jgi:cytochrome c peroxidase
MYTNNEYVQMYYLTGGVGRNEVTHQDADKHLFVVPSLLNVALTAPYFHNGSVKNLDEAVQVMAKTQLDMGLTPQQVAGISAFLGSLTGEFPTITMPRLPETPNSTLLEK